MKEYNKLYNNEQVVSKLSKYFAFLAIFISCLGLYGLVSLIAIYRTKEIGIRKVLGASLSNLLLVLSKEFVKLVFIALIIALPVAGILMHKWLQAYAYHASLSWWMFLIPAVIVLLVAIVVISRQVLKMAFTNPVESLRIE